MLQKKYTRVYCIIYKGYYIDGFTLIFVYAICYTLKYFGRNIYIVKSQPTRNNFTKQFTLLLTTNAFIYVTGYQSPILNTIYAQNIWLKLYNSNDWQLFLCQKPKCNLN